MDIQDFYSFYYLFLGGTNILASNFMDLYQIIFSLKKTTEIRYVSADTYSKVNCSQSKMVGNSAK